jgi:hypothetical protein
MPLIRGEHYFDNQFTKIPNEWVRDGDLSLKARGLLALLMSHSPGWEVSIGSLIQHGKEGRDAIKAAVSELEAAGYLRREQPRADGKFGEVLWITQTPMTGKPLTEKPLTEKPLTDNPHPKKNNNKKNNLKKNREGSPLLGAHRLPKDWKPDPETLKVMEEHFPWVDLKLETHKFRDYWQSTTKDALKKDWDATFRNWIRRTADWQKPDQPQPKRVFGMED